MLVGVTLLILDVNSSIGLDRFTVVGSVKEVGRGFDMERTTYKNFLGCRSKSMNSRATLCSDDSDSAS